MSLPASCSWICVRQVPILVVDDSAVSCEIVRYYLASLGYHETITCDNAYTALEASDPGALGRGEAGWGQSARRAKSPARNAHHSDILPHRTTRTVVLILCANARWARPQVLEQMAEEIRVVIADLDLPGMNGIEMIALLKLNEHLSHLPVIVVSGFEPRMPQHVRQVRSSLADLAATA